MSETTAERLTGAIVDAFATLAGARLHATVSATPEPDAAATEGWAAQLGLAGAHTGTVRVWFDTALVDAVGASAERAEDSAPAAASRVRALLSELGAHLSSVSAFSGIDIDVHADPAPAPAPGGRTIRFRAGDQSVGLAVVATELAPARHAAPRRSDDARLEAVLDVELPLIVRFGRTVMPLSALAELGPGSVIDMARSPDEPVDLMVGERVIARGEVVIVSGNYGVRITELLGGREASPDLEARL
jgi:flagellar motor switch protein FliN/FliY